MGNQVGQIDAAMEARFQHSYSESSKVAIKRLANMNYLPPMESYGIWEIYTYDQSDRLDLILLPKNGHNGYGLAIELLKNRDNIFYSAFHLGNANINIKNLGKYEGSFDKTLYQVCNVVDRIKRDKKSKSHTKAVDAICDELLGREPDSSWNKFLIVAGVAAGALVLLGQVKK